MLRFADAELRMELTCYIEHINALKVQARLENTYLQAKKILDQAEFTKDYEDYQEAAKQFELVGMYLDAVELAKECFEKAEIERKVDRRSKISIICAIVILAVLALILGVVPGEW